MEDDDESKKNIEGKKSIDRIVNQLNNQYEIETIPADKEYVHSELSDDKLTTTQKAGFCGCMTVFVPAYLVAASAICGVIGYLGGHVIDIIPLLNEIVPFLAKVTGVEGETPKLGAFAGTMHGLFYGLNGSRSRESKEPVIKSIHNSYKKNILGIDKNQTYKK